MLKGVLAVKYTFQRVDKPIDTLAEVEKGRYIFRILIRRRTLYVRVKILKKVSNPKGSLDETLGI